MMGLQGFKAGLISTVLDDKPPEQYLEVEDKNGEKQTIVNTDSIRRIKKMFEIEDDGENIGEDVEVFEESRDIGEDVEVFEESRDKWKVPKL